MPEDYFGVRWSGQVELAGGTYRLAATSDDGVRVFVDRQLVIDSWHPRPLRTTAAYGYLGAGSHEVLVEYFEQTERAAVQVVWERSSTGWFQSPEPSPTELGATTAP